jgi:hypothetical protein
LVQVADTTNNRYQLSEVVLLDDQTDESIGETYIVEFGNVETNSGLGTFGVRKNGSTTELTFTPLPSINTRIVGFFNALRHQDDEKDVVSFNNGSIETNYGTYFGTERDIKRAFDLKHKGSQIFRRDFDGSSVSIANTSIQIQLLFQIISLLLVKKLLIQIQELEVHKQLVLLLQILVLVLVQQINYHQVFIL